MALVLVTGPTVEPVTVQRVRAALRIEGSVFDDEGLLIDEYITSARAWCENFCERAFISQTWALTLDEWPDVVEIGRGLLTLTSITYYDADDDSTVMASDEYQLDSASEPARLFPALDTTWPVLSGRANAVRIVYVAGYGATATSVPADIKQAIRILAGHWYKHREPIATGTIVANIPYTVESLLMPYRLGTGVGVCA